MSANSERRELVRIINFFENASGNNSTLLVSNVNDETRHIIPEEVSELSVPETHFDRQAHTHHMVTEQSAQTNPIPEFLTRRILTPRNPPSHQHQNLSTQVSQDNDLPRAEQTPRTQNSDANNSINRLADAIAGIATQQQPQAGTMLKPVSTNTLIFDEINKKFELFEDLFQTMLKMQPEMKEATNINHLCARLRKEALEIFNKIVHQTKELSMTCYLSFDENMLNQNHKLQLNTNGIDSHSIPIQNRYPKYWTSLTNVPKERSVITPNKWLTVYSRQNCYSSEAILQLSLSRKWHIRPNRCTSRKRVRTQWFGKRWGADNTHNDSCNPKWKPTKHWTNKVVCHYCNKPGHVIVDCRKGMRKEQEQRNDPSI